MRWLALLVAFSATAHADISADIGFLAGPDLDGRVAGSEGDKTARAYIVKRMTDVGLTVSERAFGNTANVIGYIAGDLVGELSDSKTDLVASRKKLGCFGRSRL